MISELHQISNEEEQFLKLMDNEVARGNKHCNYSWSFKNQEIFLWSSRKHVEKLFKVFLIILFQNILLLKQFLAWNGCFGLFTKIKMRYGTSLWCTFSAWLSNKNASYLILYQWTNFQRHNSSPSQDIK